jgi:hypothetical protein
MSVKNLGSSQQLIAGQGDIIVFSMPAAGITNDTTIAQLLTNGASLGQVVQDSTSWDGEQVSFNNLLDEQGDVITSTATNGTHQFSFDLADLEPDFLKVFLGAVEVVPSESGITAVFGNGTHKVYGFGHKLPVKTRPIMITNDEGNKALFFPKAKMAGSLAWGDKIWKIHVVVTAEYVDTANLKTVMPIFAGNEVAYADGGISAETLDGNGSGSGAGA